MKKVIALTLLGILGGVNLGMEANVNNRREVIPAEVSATENTTTDYWSLRPAVDKRVFVSPAVENMLAEIVDRIHDLKLARLFSNRFPNTLDTTVKSKMKEDHPDTFVITGDIDAMWLRDSSAQVRV